jgi:L-threonylcarbamoyladenylate synthase
VNQQDPWAGLDPDKAGALERCVASGGVALFPADTVYGLACDPESETAVTRLYALKGRQPTKPAAVMWFHLDTVLSLLDEAGPRLRAALAALLPGPVTLLVPNPERRFELACAGDPLTLGVRVPRLPPALAALAGVRRPLLQSSANLAGGPDALALADVPDSIRHGVDLALDGGPLPGVASTVIDLRRYESDATWRVLRRGALAEEEVDRRLGPPERKARLP